MVVRPRWPGEETTPSASHDDSDAYSSADEASPWTGRPLICLMSAMHLTSITTAPTSVAGRSLCVKLIEVVGKPGERMLRGELAPFVANERARCSTACLLW